MLQPLDEGTQLGAYRLTDILGQGGCGIAYKAWDSTLNCNVVIKEAIPDCECIRDRQTGRLRPLHKRDTDIFEAATSQMLKEARSMAALQHPGIIPVREVFSSNGSVFLVMPYLPGGSLEQKVDEEWTPAQVKGWLRSLLSALQYLHGKGLLHRDIKPANILFDESGHPVLIDMGSVHTISAATLTNGGYTLDYAAPELIAKGTAEPGPPADLFSLAATMRELISGVAPPNALARAVEDNMRPLTDNPERVQLWGRDFLRDIDTNLSLDPAKRMQSAEAWLARSDEAPALAEPTAPRHRAALALAASGLLAAVALSTVWMLKRPSEPAAPQPSASPRPTAAAPAPQQQEERSYNELMAAAKEAIGFEQMKAEVRALAEPTERELLSLPAKLRPLVDQQGIDFRAEVKKIRKSIQQQSRDFQKKIQSIYETYEKGIKDQSYIQKVAPRSAHERDMLQQMAEKLEEDLYQSLFECHNPLVEYNASERVTPYEDMRTVNEQHWREEESQAKEAARKAEQEARDREAEKKAKEEEQARRVKNREDACKRLSETATKDAAYIKKYEQGDLQRHREIITHQNSPTCYYLSGQKEFNGSWYYAVSATYSSLKQDYEMAAVCNTETDIPLADLRRKLVDLVREEGEKKLEEYIRTYSKTRAEMIAEQNKAIAAARSREGEERSKKLAEQAKPLSERHGFIDRRSPERVSRSYAESGEKDVQTEGKDIVRDAELCAERLQKGYQEYFQNVRNCDEGKACCRRETAMLWSIELEALRLRISHLKDEAHFQASGYQDIEESCMTYIKEKVEAPLATLDRELRQACNLSAAEEKEQK